MGAQVDFRMTMKFNMRYLRRVVDRSAYEAWHKVAGYIRTTAKRSIRTVNAKGGGLTPAQIRARKLKYGPQWSRKKPKYASSLPNHPPRSKPGNRLRSSIFFDYDRSTMSVVIGPIRAWSSKALYRPTNRKTIPAVLEYGGKERKVKDVHGISSKMPNNISIANRPFMRPAREKTIRSPVFTNEFKRFLRR